MKSPLEAVLSGAPFWRTPRRHIYRPKIYKLGQECSKSIRRRSKITNYGPQPISGTRASAHHLGSVNTLPEARNITLKSFIALPYYIRKIIFPFFFFF